jgi:hypothetical protein
MPVAAVFALVLLAGPSLETDGKASLIPAKQLKSLRGLPYNILVPTTIPRGYTFDELSIESPKDKVQFSYSIAYFRKRDRARLVVQTASDGIGDVMLEDSKGNAIDPTKTLKGQNRITGEFAVEYGVGKDKRTYACVNWLELPPRHVPKYVSIVSDRAAPNDLLTLTEGLRWLKK